MFNVGDKVRFEFNYIRDDTGEPITFEKGTIAEIISVNKCDNYNIYSIDIDKGRFGWTGYGFELVEEFSNKEDLLNRINDIIQENKRLKSEISSINIALNKLKSNIQAVFREQERRESEDLLKPGVEFSNPIGEKFVICSIDETEGFLKSIDKYGRTSMYAIEDVKKWLTGRYYDEMNILLTKMKENDNG